MSAAVRWDMPLEILRQWIAYRVAMPAITPDMFDDTARGCAVIVSGSLEAAVIFFAYQPSFARCSVAIAADSPRWARKRVIMEILAYPFDVVGVNRLSAEVHYKNERSLKLSKGLGFVEEGFQRDAYGAGHHAVMKRMLRKDYAKLKERYHV